jgi:hyperosmotically inducible protein
MKIRTATLGALTLVTAMAATAPLTAVAADDPRTRTPGAVVDDAAITAKVKSALIGDQTTKAHKLDVDTKNGVVLLQGTVKSEAERSRANDLASGISGVTKVDNQLKIGG